MMIMDDHCLRQWTVRHIFCGAHTRLVANE
jgi:hypothetical protein